MPSQEDIDIQIDRLLIYRRNLAHALRQRAYHGAGMVPQSVEHSILEARNAIHRIKEILHSWGVSVENHPDDEADLRLKQSNAPDANLQEEDNMHTSSSLTKVIIEHSTEDSHIQSRYNIAIIGKTGVGKSSLINYMFAKKVAGTGTGLPVTVKGFHRYEFKIKDLPVTLFDSWGLEVGKAEEWMATLNEELAIRGVDRFAEEWFHTLFYCIDASSARVEPFEINIIKRLIKQHYKVVVVFTKADLVSEATINALINTLDTHVVENITYCEVCSEEQILRSGEKTKKFGVENLYAQITNNFLESILLRLPDRCISLLIRIIDDWHHSQTVYVKSSVRYFNAKKIINTLNRESEDFHNEFKESTISKIILGEIKRTLDLYGRFSVVIDHQFTGVHLLDSLSTEGMPSMPWGVMLSGGYFHALNIAVVATAIATGTFPPLGIVLGGIFFSAIGGFNMYYVRVDNEKKILANLDSFSEQYKSEVIKIRPLISDMLKKNILNID